ncbi:hypothetical protein [Ruminococcus sp.]|jgi:hypothetical protein|uniref:hypothetical protein n=1 Tax=Ruminococcus sp. TaxID=41978 RepID=UPI00205E30F7|nr:MAG TPA: hypothetical protein [Caudoviricetes sp.]DAP79362.1 MAG TPA: hypothetical protein [Caudoviricetes sp.]
MLIHAENEKQKEVTAIHICKGSICGNCLNYHKGILNWQIGCCMCSRSPVERYDYCSLFKEVNRK